MIRLCVRLLSTESYQLQIDNIQEGIQKRKEKKKKKDR